MFPGLGSDSSLGCQPPVQTEVSAPCLPGFCALSRASKRREAVSHRNPKERIAEATRVVQPGPQELSGVIPSLGTQSPFSECERLLCTRKATQLRKTFPCADTLCLMLGETQGCPSHRPWLQVTTPGRHVVGICPVLGFVHLPKLISMYTSGLCNVL